MGFIMGNFKSSVRDDNRANIEIQFGIEGQYTELRIITSWFGRFTYNINGKAHESGCDQVAVAELASIFSDKSDIYIVGGKLPMLYYLLTNMTDIERYWLARTCISYNGTREREYIQNFISFILLFFDLKYPKMMKRIKMEYRLE